MNAYKHTYPLMCGYYSITTDRDFDESPSSLKYFKLPKAPLDLNEGIQEIKEKPDSYFEGKMDNLLKYIVKDKAFLVNNKDYPEKAIALIPSTKYITRRGTLRLIMGSPYGAKSGWRILVSKYKGNIYMCHLKDPEEVISFKNEPFSSKRFTFYGPKFQQYCLSDDPSKMPDTSERVDDCTQFFCVFKRNLVGRNFLFSGEMDGIVSDTPVKLDNPENYRNLKFIELKVTASHAKPITKQNFDKFKCLSVWIQSFIAGVKDIYFGFRDHQGIVNKIEHYRIDRLRRNWERYWDPSECFEFLTDFLQLVEDKVEKVDCPNTVHEFNYNEKTRAISHKIHDGKTELSFLPKWYLDAVNSD